MARGGAVRAKLIGLDDLFKDLDRLSDAVAEKGLIDAGRAGALLIQNEAKVLVRRRSGTLSRSIHNEVAESGPRRAVIHIGTDLIYAAIHEFGGTIKPKRGKFLRFKNQAGEYVFTKQVTIRAHPYMRPAFDTKRAAAIAEIRAALKTLVEKAAK
jgi:HK97 gp10 family phage protein